MKHENEYVFLSFFLAIIYFLLIFYVEGDNSITKELNCNLNIPTQDQVKNNFLPILTEMEKKEEEYMKLSTIKLVNEFNSKLKNREITEIDRSLGYFNIYINLRQKIGPDYDKYCYAEKKRIDGFEYILKEKGYTFDFYDGYCFFPGSQYIIKVYL